MNILIKSWTIKTEIQLYKFSYNPRYLHYLHYESYLTIESNESEIFNDFKIYWERLLYKLKQPCISRCPTNGSPQSRSKVKPRKYLKQIIISGYCRYVLCTTHRQLAIIEHVVWLLSCSNRLFRKVIAG